MDADGVPVLWHLKVSHYNEKARWALDYKRVPHRRRAVTPGEHRAVAKRLTGGTTLPVLELDGAAIGDSTQIIAELERRHPEPALYPSDPAERRRALELEDLFDEELGPHLRLLVVNATLPRPPLLLATFAPDLAPTRRAVARAIFPLLRRRIRSDFGIDAAAVAAAYAKVEAAGARFRTELGPSGYLVGDRFSVADLTLAALVSPAVAPEEFPYPQAQRGHPALAPVRAALGSWGLDDWARDVYSRHRGSSAEIA